MKYSLKSDLSGIILVLSILIPYRSIAQAEEKLYEQALDQFYKEKFVQAYELFTEVLKINPDFKDADYRAEICKLVQPINRELPLNKLLTFYTSSGKEDKFFYYWVGRVYVNRYMFPEAVEAWKTFLKQKGPKSIEIIDETKDFINETKKLVTYFDNPDNYEIHRLESPVNSAAAEMTPVYFEDQKELIYASSFASGKELKIYESKKSNGKWSQPSEISNIGTFKKENANIEVVNEDKKLFFFQEIKGGDLFYTQPNSNGWAPPVEFDSKITTTHVASHFFINAKEDRIIFGSDFVKKRGIDLYESYKDPATGKWSKPTLFSETISSDFDEDTPFLSPDEQRIYFSSNRPNGVGGFDVYMATINPKTKVWSKPENLGWPINSPDDDIQFKLNQDQESGYFVSNRIHSMGDFDIFLFWQIEKAFVEGRVFNAIDNIPLTTGEIRFHPSNYTDEYFRSILDENGKYRTEVISDEIFRVEIISGIDTLSIEQYEVHDSKGEAVTHFKDFYYIPSNASPEQVTAYQKRKEAELAAKAAEVKQPETLPKSTPIATTTIEKPQEPKSTASSKVKSEPEPTIQKPTSTPSQSNLMKNYSVGSKAILHNLYFDVGTSQLSKNSESVLEELFILLKSNPNLKVEISGHTDNIGAPAVNQWLSKQRAESVAKWLTQKGIDSSRLVTKGYGESRPLASNDDEENGRELNRRIEVLIIEGS